MKIANTFALLVLGIASAAHAGVSEIYISYSNSGPGAAADTSSTGALQSTGTGYIWLSEGQDIDTGIFLDIQSSDASVINFTSAVADNPLISLLGGSVVIDRRWTNEDFTGGDAVGGTVNSDDINRWRAFRVNGGSGIENANDGSDNAQTLDEGYFAGSGFLLGSFDFVVTGEGTTTFTASAHIDADTGTSSGSIVHQNEDLLLGFGSATFTGVAIPEPGTAGLLILGLAGLSVRRRR